MNKQIEHSSGTRSHNHVCLGECQSILLHSWSSSPPTSDIQTGSSSAGPAPHQLRQEGRLAWKPDQPAVRACPLRQWAKRRTLIHNTQKRLHTRVWWPSRREEGQPRMCAPTCPGLHWKHKDPCMSSQGGPICRTSSYSHTPLRAQRGTNTCRL
jgi:hypothetical protein